jgi:hypothetical protein
MWKRRGMGALTAALLGCACSAGSSSGSAGVAQDPEAAWMDQAAVIVSEDPCAGVETVRLVDEPTGHDETVSTESFAPDPAACGQAPTAGAQALAVAESPSS